MTVIARPAAGVLCSECAPALVVGTVPARCTDETLVALSVLALATAHGDLGESCTMHQLSSEQLARSDLQDVAET